MYDYQQQQRQLLKTAETMLEGAKSASRSLSTAERSEVERLLTAAEDSRDMEKIHEQILGMKSTGVRSSGLFDPGELGQFVKAAAAGDTPPPLRAKANLTTATVGGFSGDYKPGVIGSLTEPFRVRRLFPEESTDAPSVFYRRITTGSAAAATVAEGALKPESTIVAAQVEAPVRKVAVYLPVAEELIQDGGESFVRDIVADLVRDLIRAENVQLLSGNGTAPNLAGILSTSGLQTRARGTDSNLDAILKGMTMLRTIAFLEPTDVLVHPTNWETIRLSKETGGAYLLSDPLAAGQPTLAGATVHLSTDLPLGTALIVNAAELARVYGRTPIQVSWGTVGDQFQRNIISAVAEERLAFGVRRPTAGVSVTALN